jgi:hypothetical protein
MEATIEKSQSDLKDKINTSIGNNKSENIHFELNKKDSIMLEDNTKSNELDKMTSQSTNIELNYRKKSSDFTSESISQYENLSQTSESSTVNQNCVNSN